MESVENVVVGAGPAGLRVAQVLAEAGREVVVLERNDKVGPKTCGGGLSVKAVRELQQLGLPLGVGVEAVAHASFRNEPAAMLDPEHARIVTLSRETLGRYQLTWAVDAGAEIRLRAVVTAVDVDARVLTIGKDQRLQYRRLIGADGSSSIVRRALGLDASRAFFAGEYNVPLRHDLPLHIAFESRALASGYFWVFPHATHTCVGAGAHKRLVRPASIKPYVERRMAELGIERGATAYEGASIEVEYRGLHFAPDVHLAGDAGGLPSALTAEGIYAALISGEETARRILDPEYPMPKTRHWLSVKRSHDRLGRLWLRRMPREMSLAALPALCRRAASRRWLSAYFLES